MHTDCTDPYCPEISLILKEAMEQFGYPYHMGGTYVATEGPRFETRAEIKAYGILGGDVVGMTGVPEIVLAKELTEEVESYAFFLVSAFVVPEKREIKTTERGFT